MFKSFSITSVLGDGLSLRHIKQITILGVDSIMRLAGTFLVQSNSDVPIINALFLFVAISSFYMSPYSFITVAIPKRFAHFGTLHKPLIKIYYSTLIFIGLSGFILMLILSFFTYEIELYGPLVMANVLSMVMFGLTLSIYKSIGRIEDLLMYRVFSSLLYLLSCTLYVYFDFNLSLLFLLLVFTSHAPFILANNKLLSLRGNERKIHIFRDSYYFRWVYKSAISSSSLIFSIFFFSLVVFIDRYIFSYYAASDKVTAFYAISCTICAPIPILMTLFNTNVYSKVLKRNDSSNVNAIIQGSFISALASVAVVFSLYFIIIQLNIFQEKNPPLDIFLTCVFYFTCYSLSQVFNLYLGGLHNKFKQYFPFLLCLLVLYIFNYYVDISPVFSTILSGFLVFLPMLYYYYINYKHANIGDIK